MDPFSGARHGSEAYTLTLVKSAGILLWWILTGVPSIVTLYMQYPFLTFCDTEIATQVFTGTPENPPNVEKLLYQLSFHIELSKKKEESFLEVVAS